MRSTASGTCSELLADLISNTRPQDMWRFLLGGVIGYLLASRAGRGPYERLRRDAGGPSITRQRTQPG
ncbi:MAG: hypothetical protein LC721_05810 [Actinobacteria bacterium]|nr:hypothetical protein [Actinomycetota bacterium]